MNATLIIPRVPNMRGDARLYRLNPPLASDDYDDEANAYALTTHEYVVVSAAIVFGDPETYLFRATSDGTVTDWAELPGSQKGTLDHERVLADLGYAVTPPAPDPSAE